MLERATGKKFAAKIIDFTTEVEMENYLNEFRLFISIDSSFVIKCHQVFCSDNKLFAIMDFMNCGSLQDVMDKIKFKDLSIQSCKYVLWCVAMGIAALHDR